ncbi:MAG TPA: sigma-70 family RNA polymerase sigma factor [Planctomycetota bacterium]|nr:sigma-70 family RNA polymerase sigma factor [Planctomycetota bacterium]
MPPGRDDFENTLHLVARAQAEDETALHALFERYLPRVRRIAALRLGKRPNDVLDIDDITQEALADAFQRLDRFDVDSDGKFCNWLATIVENRIRMTLRSGRAHKRGGGRLQRFGDAAESVHASHLPGDEPTPSQHARGAELGEQMERALLELPERYREIIIHRYYCQMEYAEIAPLTGLANADAVRAVYSRALRELRARLG